MAAVPAIDFTVLLKDVPLGAWVALSSDRTRVLKYGSDINKVLADAKATGEEDPIIMRVPECPLTLVL